MTTVTGTMVPLFFQQKQELTPSSQRNIGVEESNTDSTCKLCGEEVEDIVHFLIKCEKLEEKREYRIIDGTTQDPVEKLRRLLFENKKYQETGRMIKKPVDTQEKYER